MATVAQLGAARRLAERKVLVRNPRAIEALGRVDVICADKTGTLTDGHLLLRVVSDGLNDRIDDVMPAQLRRILEAALRATPDGDPDELPHPTDRAETRGGVFHGMSNVDGGVWTLIDTSPFDPRRGYHAVLGRVGNDHIVVAQGRARGSPGPLHIVEEG